MKKQDRKLIKCVYNQNYKGWNIYATINSFGGLTVRASKNDQEYWTENIIDARQCIENHIFKNKLSSKENNLAA